MIIINKSKLYLSIYLFFLIFMPPIIPKINVLYFVFVFSFVVITINMKKELYYIINNNIIKKFNISFLLYSIFATIHIVYDCLFGNKLELIEYIYDVYNLVGVGILINVCAIYVVCYSIKHKFNIFDICSCLIYAGLLQGIICCLAILFPIVKNKLNSIFIHNVYGSLENSGILSWTFKERLYGFANVLYDGFGYGTGVIAGISFLSLFENKFSLKRILFFVVLFIVPTVNAITGFFITVIAILLRVAFSLNNKKTSLSKICTVIMVLIILIIGYVILENKASYAVERLQSNIWAILGKNDGITSYKNLTRKSYWTIPDKLINVLFGTGHSVYTTKKFVHSDTGYTNSVWLVGIIGSLWLYGIFIVSALRIIRVSCDKFKKELMYFCIISFLFFEIKGIGISINTGISVVLIIMYSLAVFGQNIKMETRK